MKIPVLEDLAKKAIEILAKYEVIDQKVRDLGETLRDHDRRICKLEGAYELNLTKLKNAVLEEALRLKLPQK